MEKCLKEKKTQIIKRRKQVKKTYFRRSCRSGPGYWISIVLECPGTENVLRQSTKRPKLTPKRGRPCALYSYRTKSCTKKMSNFLQVKENNTFYPQFCFQWNKIECIIFFSWLQSSFCPQTLNTFSSNQLI